MDVAEIKISRYHKIINGIKVMHGEQWYVIQENEIDYILNGYMFININYIKTIKQLTVDNIKYQILNLKYVPVTFDTSLDNYENLLFYIKQQNLLISIGLENDGYIIVGKISNVLKRYLVIDKIGTNTENIGQAKIYFSKIRFLEIRTDYLNSLELYMTAKSTLIENA